jgi:hypothetical protein
MEERITSLDERIANLEGSIAKLSRDMSFIIEALARNGSAATPPMTYISGRPLLHCPHLHLPSIRSPAAPSRKKSISLSATSHTHKQMYIFSFPNCTKIYLLTYFHCN